MAVPAVPLCIPALTDIMPIIMAIPWVPTSYLALIPTCLATALEDQQFTANGLYGNARYEIADDDRFGKAISFVGCRSWGDAITRQRFACSSAAPCNVSFYVKGTVYQGFSTTTSINSEMLTPDMKPDHVWTMCADGYACVWGDYWPRPPLRYGTTPAFADNWTLVEYQYDGLYGDGREEPEHHLVFQAYEVFVGQQSLAANCSQSFVADVRVNGEPLQNVTARRLGDLQRWSSGPPASEDPMLNATLSDGQILQVFRLLDSEGSGVISAASLGRLGARLGAAMSDEEVQVMLDGADVDGDGDITEEEFLLSAKNATCS